jgi:hypothetical protein
VHTRGLRPNPLMQPTNASGVGRRPCPSLPEATKDHRFSRGRLQLISHPLGRFVET